MAAADAGATLFLRAVVANFAATIDDTNDLSTIRGSSLAALDLPGAMVHHVRAELAGRADVSVVYQGASEILAQVSLPAAAGTEAKRLRDALVRIKGDKADAGAKARAARAALAQAGLDGRFAATLAALEGASDKGASDKAGSDKAAKNTIQDIVDALRADTGLRDLIPAIERACGDFAAGRVDGLACATDFTMLHAVREARPGVPFGDTLKALTAETNTRQYQRLTLPLPGEAPPRPARVDEAVCAYDRVRPALPGTREKGRPVSGSVHRRRQLGRQQKQHFYERELARLRDDAPDAARRAALETTLDRLRGPLDGQDWAFATSIADFLETATDDPDDPLPAGLAGKVALLYLDGNNFGARRHPDGTTPQRLGNFSRHVAAWRGDLLCALLGWALHHPDMRVDRPPDEGRGPSRRLRLETLLWGGDELLWLLPAHCAWDAMGVVQEHLARWTGPDGDAKPLTHCAGLLVAPHKAPVRDLRRLAAALGDAAKDKDAAGRSAERNSVQVLVVDGIDQPDPALAAIRAARCGVSAPPRAFDLDGGRWGEIGRAIGAAKAALPRRQLHRHARDPALADTPDAMIARLCALTGRNGTDAAFAVFDAGNPLLTPDAGQHPRVLLHQLLMLWDLVDPRGGREVRA